MEDRNKDNINNDTSDMASAVPGSSEFQKPEKRAIEMWSVGRLIGFLAVAAIGVFVLWILGLTGAHGGYWTLLRVAIWIVMAYFFAAIAVLPKIEYKQWGYKVLEDQVVIRHGIFWIDETVIPIVRIQNITKSQGPIARMFDLFDVEIAIASGTFDICGVTEETADAISQNLKSRLYTRIEKKGQDIGDGGEK